MYILLKRYILIYNYNLNTMFIFNINEIILNNKNNIKYEKNLKKNQK